MFYLIKYYKHLMILACFFPVLYGGLRILGKRSWSSIKAWAAGYHLFKGKRLLSLVILLVFLLNFFMLPLYEGRNASAEISLNYAKASQGLNPNGTRYNQMDILGGEVLERAIEKGALTGVGVNDLKEVLSVGPLVQGASHSEDAYFISTQFGIYYNASPNTAHLKGETLLTLVTEAYKEWFIREYSENIRVLKLDFTETEKEDYLDICEFLRKQAEAIGRYMLTLSGEEAAFQSQSSGETFQSISSQAYTVADVMVERLEAYVLADGISKETGRYVERLKIQNVFKDFDARKAAAASENNLTAISMYENDMARIVLVPTYDTNYQFYMSQTRIGIDDFAADADSFANSKTAIHSEMARNEHVVQMLSGRYEPDGINEKAELLISQIEAELNRLARAAQNLVKEFSNRQANEYMTITVFTREQQAASIIMEIFAYTLLFAVCIHICMLGVHINKNSRKRSGGT